ncbi:MAG: hypothetical protein B7X08_00180 [Acidocella sp. 20-63-7]|nr:MAG: hypothetical protein B7X08_00180 [Acidocella sp. 20-63-7]HQT45636.1 EAL domain-containing protein [Acidocella sp.]
MNALSSTSWLGRILAFFALPSEDPELARSQFSALSRQIPLLYVILIIDASLLAATHFHSAPHLLTLSVPTLLLVATSARLIAWIRVGSRQLSDAQVLAQLRLTVLLAGLMGIAFTIWSFSLFHYGDKMQQGGVAFYMGITVVCCVFCLMHLRAAALLVTMVVVIPFTIFFAGTGEPVLVAMAINMLLVSVGMIVVMLRNHEDFTALITSRRELMHRQQETQLLSDENLRLANLDPLSSLPNRRRFFAELQESIANAERHGQRLAVGLLDLDRFKGVNDLHGHAAGDRLLTQVGLRLKRLVNDNIFIARLGGDEFGVILTNVPTDEEIFAFGAKVKALLEAPCVVGDRLASVGGSVGVAIYPEAGYLAEELFERADYALYHGKQNARGGLVIFSNEHETVIRHSGRVEQAFRLADLEAELWVAFQPIVDIVEHRIIAFEALARWNSHELGPIGPDVFIPIAERVQMMSLTTEVLLGKTLAAVRHWPEGVSVCFNLSAQDLIADETMRKIRRAILNSGVPPARIEFEVTETALLQDFELAERAIDSLHAMGVRISLDDFGTGFSSLSYVHKLPLDKIKIDRSFVSDVDTSRTSPSIIKTIVALCANLKLDCVVEGVETESQLRTVAALGCRNIQGYLLSRPIPADMVTRLIHQFAGRIAVPYQLDVAGPSD